jgi:bifunctional non-homologous end joining protein LigD
VSPAARKRAASKSATPSTSGAVIGGVSVSNPDKVWFPDDGITKGDVVRFYDSVASRIDPWLRDRPLSAERCPDGMLGGCFYQKDFPEDRPPKDAPRVAVHAASTGKVVRYVVGGAKTTLLALANLGCIAMHVIPARTSDLHEPDWLALDMDPMSGEFADAARAGLALRRLLDEARLPSFPKTSGSRGLHVFVPLKPGHTDERVVAFATALGNELAKRDPSLVTMTHAKAARGARVYADPFRNGYMQTIVSPYSVRRRPRAPVSTPLAWDEVSPKLDPATFNIRTFDQRSAADPWKQFKRSAVHLPS